MHFFPSESARREIALDFAFAPRESPALKTFPPTEGPFFFFPLPGIFAPPHMLQAVLRRSSLGVEICYENFPSPLVLGDVITI